MSDDNLLPFALSKCPWMARKQKRAIETARKTNPYYVLNAEDWSRIEHLAPRLCYGFLDHLFECGIWHYGGASLEELEKLIGMGLADPNDRHNDCPSIAEIVAWMRANPGAFVSGYLVVGRQDGCISVDTVGHRGPMTAEQAAEFRRVFGKADELHVRKRNQWAWFD